VASGASVVGLNSVAGYENGEVVVFVIDPTNATKKQTFTGVVDTSGVQITNVVWTAGTNQTHDAGATVVDWPSATHVSMISKGLLVQHNQDGTHGTITGASLNVTDGVTSDTISERTPANGVTIDSLNIKDGKLNTANSVVTANYTDASILPEHLAASTGTSWAWQTWTPSWNSLTIGNATQTAYYTQVGKLVVGTIKLTWGSTTSCSSNPAFALPVANKTSHYSDDYYFFGGVELNDVSGVRYPGSVYLDTNGTDAIFLTHVVSGSNIVMSTVTATGPITWTTGDIWKIHFAYEAA
jgi:hypothetical protein